MKSIRVRLIVLFIFVTTVMLGAFGVYAQMLLSRELETRFAQLQEGAVTRLKINLPAPLWNYDLPIIERIIEAEMLPPEVRAVYVLDAQEKIMSGIVRTKDGKLAASQQTSEATGTPITDAVHRPSSVGGQVKDKPVGKLIVYFSRDRIDEALRFEISRRVVEVLALDLLLVVVLTLSLRMVFGPLGQLRDALFDLASHDTEDVEELPDTQPTEFGEVIKGFNQTQRKLKQVILKRSQAEEEAREAATRTAEALERLKTAQDELIKSGKLAALGSLVAGIAHELNTPIGNGLMAVSTLRDDLKAFQDSVSDKGLKKSSFETFMKTVDTATEITERSLKRSADLVASFKQIAVDQTTSQRRKFDLAELVKEVLSVLDPTLKRTPYKVEASIPAGIRMDSFPGPLEQVLTNFVTNAIVHAFDGRDHGVIKLTVEPTSAENIVLKVTDDGKGIGDKDLPRIFDPFFTTKLGKGGSGLGLHIVHNMVVQILGGSIDVSSEVGVGTEFKLVLPISAPAASLPQE